MAKEANSWTKLQWLLSILVTALIAASFSLSSWTATKVITLDKEIVQLRAAVEENTEDFDESKEMFEDLQQTQQQIHIDVVKIGQKLGVDVD